MHPREERFALNENLFRRANERILGVAVDSSAASGLIEFYCECGDRDCVERIPLTAEAYQSIRADRAQFVVVPGHTEPDVEVIVERHDNHVVVRKTGEAAQVAIEGAPEDGD